MYVHDDTLRWSFALMGFLLGASVASFVETAAHRLVTGRPFWGRERSICESCGRRLETLDLIPIASFLWFRGRCRSCGARIPGEYLLYEVFTAGAYALVLYAYGLSLEAVSCMAMFAFGMFHGVTDLESGFVYDGVSLASLLAGVLLGFADLGLVGVKRSFLGAIMGFLPLAIIVVVSWGRMGIGDAILMGGLGAFLGPFGALLGVYLGLLMGGIWAIVQVILGRLKGKDPVPLAPFLWGGSFLAFLSREWVWGLARGILEAFSQV